MYQNVMIEDKEQEEYSSIDEVSDKDHSASDDSDLA